MSKNFAVLLGAIEKAGVAGHDAYELANQVDKSLYRMLSDAEIAKVGARVAQEELELQEALGNCAYA